MYQNKNMSFSSDPSTDCTVSFQIGRAEPTEPGFGSAKTYRFPQTEDEHRFARIEVRGLGYYVVQLSNVKLAPVQTLGFAVGK